MKSGDLFLKHTFDTHSDERGNLTVADKLDKLLDWPIKRSYWISGTKLPRGGHCVKGEKKLYIMAQGSCNVKIFDGNNWYEMALNGPSEALEFKFDLWREFSGFSDQAVMFTLCNAYYNKEDYILDVSDYEKYIKSVAL